MLGVGREVGIQTVDSSELGGYKGGMGDQSETTQ